MVKYIVSTFLDLVRPFSNWTRAPVSIEAAWNHECSWVTTTTSCDRKFTWMFACLVYSHARLLFYFTRGSARGETTSVREWLRLQVVTEDSHECLRTVFKFNILTRKTLFLILHARQLDAKPRVFVSDYKSWQNIHTNVCMLSKFTWTSLSQCLVTETLTLITFGARKYWTDNCFNDLAL